MQRLLEQQQFYGVVLTSEIYYCKHIVCNSCKLLRRSRLCQICDDIVMY